MYIYIYIYIQGSQADQVLAAKEIFPVKNKVLSIYLSGL